MLKRRLIIAALIIATGAFASFYGGSARTLFYIFLLIPLFSILYTVYVYVRFRIYQDAENKIIVKGEKTPYFFVLSNQDYISYTDIRVEFLEDFSTPQNMELNQSYCLIPGQRNEYHTEILCHYRGEYNIGVKSIVVTDFLGLMRIRYPVHLNIRMSVLPKITEIDRISLSPLDEDSKLLRFSHYSSTEPPDCETRKYITGDSVKLINWKISAKKRELYVRQSSDSHNTGVVLIMDMMKISADDYTRIIMEDKIIECALTTADYLVKKRVSLTVVYEQNDMIRSRIDTPEQLKIFYSKCAGIKFNSTYSPEELYSTLPQSHMNGFVIFAVSRLTDKLCQICENIIRLDGDAAILLIGDSGAEYSGILNKQVIFKHISLHDEVCDILGGAASGN